MKAVLFCGGIGMRLRDGFWACLDTFKDKQRFDAMNAHGETPWQVWKSVAGERVYRPRTPNARTAS
jgi:hypothetical protein